MLLQVAVPRAVGRGARRPRLRPSTTSPPASWTSSSAGTRTCSATCRSQAADDVAANWDAIKARAEKGRASAPSRRAALGGGSDLGATLQRKAAKPGVRRPGRTRARGGARAARRRRSGGGVRRLPEPRQRRCAAVGGCRAAAQPTSQRGAVRAREPASSATASAPLNVRCVTPAVSRTGVSTGASRCSAQSAVDRLDLVVGRGRDTARHLRRCRERDRRSDGVGQRAEVVDHDRVAVTGQR